MKTNYLFPNQYKKIGWLLLIPGILLGILYLIYGEGISIFGIKVLAIKEPFGTSENSYFSISDNNVLDELSSMLIIIGLLLIAFSKGKLEDEFISKIRLKSLLWATYANYLILIITIIFVYDLLFFWVLVFNMFTLLIFFLVLFNWVLYKYKKQIVYEK